MPISPYSCISLDRYFQLTARGSSLGREFRAGTATFLTLSPSIMVNAQLMSGAGIPINSAAVATSLSCCVGCLLLGVFANLPFALAPGLGLSAYFTYGMVLGPSSNIGIDEALTACFWAGTIMALLAVSTLTSRLLRCIPNPLKLATVVGMGLLITFIALKNSQIVVPNSKSIVALGDLMSLTVCFTFVGLTLIATLEVYEVAGATLWVILIITCCSWLVNSTYPTTAEELVGVPSLSGAAGRVDLTLTSWKLLPGVFGFLSVAVFDVAGCVIGLGEMCGLVRNGHTLGETAAMTATSVATMIAAFFGCTPVIIALESGAGVREGGRTGLTAISAGFWFLLASFLAPLFSHIPAEATCPVLLCVACGMMSLAARIDWTNISEALPAFLCLALMPLTFSLPNGVGAGIAMQLALSITTRFKARNRHEESLLSSDNSDRKRTHSTYSSIECTEPLLRPSSAAAAAAAVVRPGTPISMI